MIDQRRLQSGSAVAAIPLTALSWRLRLGPAIRCERAPAFVHVFELAAARAMREEVAGLVLHEFAFASPATLVAHRRMMQAWAD